MARMCLLYISLLQYWACYLLIKIYLLWLLFFNRNKYVFINDIIDIGNVNNSPMINIPPSIFMPTNIISNNANSKL